MIWAALGGAGLIALATTDPIWWVAAALYHLALGGWALADALTLPSRAGFAAGRQVPDPLGLGVPGRIRLRIEHPAAGGLTAEAADHAPPELGRGRPVVSGNFDARGCLDLDYEVRPPSRGAFAFGPLDVRCRRARGWWWRQVEIELQQECTVYPDALRVREYNLSVRRRMPFLSGSRRARPPGAASAFAGLRDYLAGDDVRRVNWTATARRDHPVVNEMEAERGQPVMIALDCGRLMTASAGHLTKLDQAVNAALLLAWVAQRHGDRVGLMTFSDRVQQMLKPARGPAQIHLLNEVLYRARPDPVEPDFGAAFASLSNRIGHRALVVVLTDVLDRTSSGELMANALWLSHRHLVLVVAMADPALLDFRMRPLTGALRVYEWAATEELLRARRESFEILRRGGVLSLDVRAGTLSPALVERYLELKERGLV